MRVSWYQQSDALVTEPTRSRIRRYLTSVVGDSAITRIITVAMVDVDDSGGLTAQVDWLGLRVGGHPALSLHQRFSNWGPRTKGGPRRVPTGSSRGFRKVVIVCTVFNNLRPMCFQICTRKSVTQSQCIAWKCCRGLARRAFC